MCAGAIYTAGIRRVSFVLSKTDVYEVVGAREADSMLQLPASAVFTSGAEPTVVQGPAPAGSSIYLEALQMQRDFWSRRRP